jgi:uncharacterized membrane protein YkvA (DUF1232 family)
MSNRSARRCYHAGPITEAGPEASADLKLSSSTRYLRLARVIVRLPMYARIVWGLMRDPRTPAGLKGMLAAALAYVVMPVDVIPDAIPIVGHADDLTVLLLVLDLFINNAPPEVRAEHTARARNGTADLDRDLERLRALLGERYEQIRDNLPELLDRYGRLRDPAELKRALATWRQRRMRPMTPKELE